MKKHTAILALVLSLGFPQLAYAQTIGGDVPNIQDTYGYYVSSGRTRKFPFMSQTEQGKSYTDTRTGYNYSAKPSRNQIKDGLSRACGPLSLLMLRNNKYRQATNKKTSVLLSDVTALRAAAGISSDIDTNVYELKKMAGHELVGLARAQHDEDLEHEARFNNGREFSGSVLDLKAIWKVLETELANGSKAIVVLDTDSVVPPNVGYRHFVTVYKIKNYASTGEYGNTGYVYYLDPWTGQSQARSKDDFLKSLYLDDTQDYLIVK